MKRENIDIIYLIVQNERMAIVQNSIAWNLFQIFHLYEWFILMLYSILFVVCVQTELFANIE